MRFCRAGALLLPLLALALPVPEARATVILNRQSAVNALVSQLGLSGISVAWCPYQNYGFGPGFEGVLPAGTTVRPANLNTQPFPGNVAQLSAEMYFFFVDDDPKAAFTHRVRYVYVDATVSSPSLASGSIFIQEQGWWPFIQRPSFSEEEIFGATTRYSVIPGAYNNPDGLVFGSFIPPYVPAETPAQKPVPNVTAATANNCAIVFSGVPTNAAAGTADAGLHGSAQNMNAQLLARGVPAGRIQNKRNGNQQDLRNAVTALCAAMPACDKIYVAISTHGSKGALQMQAGNMVSADTLCAILKPLGAKGVPVCLMIEACHAGSLVSTLRPKFPEGVIITASGADTICWTDTVEDGMGNPIDNSGFFGHAFIRCWNNPAASTDGDTIVTWAEAYKWVCQGTNGNVRWHGSDWNVKTLGPALTGLPEKTIHWQAPSGAWYVEIHRDTDNDGKYDEHDWGRDDDCDGNLDVIYLNNDIDEDGKKESTICLRDLNDDGTPDTRYIFTDSNDDGNTDNIQCFNWSGSNWILTAQAPRRVGNFAINPPFGGRYGDQSFTIQGLGGTQWLNPNVAVFIGSHVKNFVYGGPTNLSGVTNGYTEGPVNVIVADFNNSSPTYGFVERPLAYNYQPVLFAHSVDPVSGHCGAFTTIQVHGTGFEPTSQVYAGVIPVPTTYISANQLAAQLGPNCGTTVPIRVENMSGALAQIENAFEYLPSLDTMAPEITCPADLQLNAGPDNLARTPSFWQATASDPSGLFSLRITSSSTVSVFRNLLGALPLGMNLVPFEAVDGAGNRSACTSIVDVNLSGSAGNPPVPFQLVGNFPNPFTPSTVIRFTLDRSARARISAFDAMGRRVAVLLDETRSRGSQEVAWDGRDDAGRELPSGIYFLKLEAGDKTATKQATILR